jgi:hypothetical protein
MSSSTLKIDIHIYIGVRNYNQWIFLERLHIPETPPPVYGYFEFQLLRTSGLIACFYSGHPGTIPEQLPWDLC